MIHKLPRGSRQWKPTWQLRKSSHGGSKEQ